MSPRQAGWHHRPRFRLFETVELNAVGWAALLGPGLLVGGLGGLLISDNWQYVVIGSAVGACAALGVAVGLDRRRHLTSFVNYGVDDSDRAVEILAQSGICATAGAYPEQEWIYVTVQQRDLHKAVKLLEERPAGD